MDETQLFYHRHIVGMDGSLVAADPELHLLSEQPLDGMRGGNLSGLFQWGGHLWTVSDRDDVQIYRLDTQSTCLEG